MSRSERAHNTVEKSIARFATAKSRRGGPRNNRNELLDEYEDDLKIKNEVEAEVMQEELAIREYDKHMTDALMDDMFQESLEAAE